MKPETDNAEFFVSRRGRQIGVHEVDLTGIDIENDDRQLAPLARKRNESQQPSAAQRPDKKAPPADLVKPKKPRSPQHKYRILAIILIVLALPLLGAELVRAQYAQAITQSAALTDELVRTDVQSAQKLATIPSTQIKTIADKVNDIATSMCRGGMLDNAASLYPRAKTAHDDCKDAQRHYTELGASLQLMADEVKYLERIANVVKPVSKPITEEFAVIGSQLTMWQKVSDDTKKIIPPSTMKDAHQTTLGAVTALTTSWSELNQANNNQDAAAFTAAGEAMGQQYEAIRSLGSEYTARINQTQSAVSAAYAALPR